MKLILTDYIASLKEDRELDQFLQDMLREYDFEIVFGPQKGVRQYGVDIYAVGNDWEDGKKKVFLLTVKQGNLDRKNWQGSPQSIKESLEDIVDVFIRNNLATEHQSLPVKIIVAHNGLNEAAIQQNWTALTEKHPQYSFCIWQLETIANLAMDKMINEQAVTDNQRTLLRKIIIYLFNPDYDLEDFKLLLDEILNQAEEANGPKRIGKQFRKLNLIVSIVISFCEKEDDERLALKATEIAMLRVWQFIRKHEQNIDKSCFSDFIRLTAIRQDVGIKYLRKITPVCEVKDGLSRCSPNAITYNMVVYEHLGFIALLGLDFLQLADFFIDQDSVVANTMRDFAEQSANCAVHLFNNNPIVYTPRADNQIIELNMVFMLLYKLERQQNIIDILYKLNNHMGSSKLLLSIMPLYRNKIETIIELDADAEQRKAYQYGSSSLLTTLTEWTLCVNNEELYISYQRLKENVFSDIELTLWYPDDTTEALLYTTCALPESGYCLSNIVLPDSFEAFAKDISEDYEHNCQEKDFSFIKNKLWIIGLIASRHFRTYPFPHYWRQWINSMPDTLAPQSEPETLSVP